MPSPEPEPDASVSGVGVLPLTGISQSRDSPGWPVAAQLASTVALSHQLTGVHDGGLPLSGTCSRRMMPPALSTSCISSPVTPQTAVSPSVELSAPHPDEQLPVHCGWPPRRTIVASVAWYAPCRL